MNAPEPPKRETRPARTGSSMSAKQMGRAAAEGRTLTFRFLKSAVNYQGYLVGMDDYHWLVAVPNEELPGSVEVHLLHKGTVDVVSFGSPSLHHEEPDTLALINRVGSKFFEHCRLNYLPTTRSN